MKLLSFCFFMLIAGLLHAQINFYDLSVVSVSGEVVNLSAYKGKKLLIVVASPGALLAKSSSRYLGQIQSSNPEIEVLILPHMLAADSSSVAEVKQYTRLNNTRIGRMTDAKENKLAPQAPLLQWLTQASKNQHFDAEITSDEQFYVINESGVLYAVLEKGVSESFLKMVLAATDVKP